MNNVIYFYNSIRNILKNLWIKYSFSFIHNFIKYYNIIQLFNKVFFVQENLINKTLKGISSDIPVWFLRQAGRHLPEYFEIRKKEKNFIKFCFNDTLGNE